MGKCYGHKVMADNGDIFNRVEGTDCPQAGNFILTLLLCFGRVESVITIKDGEKVESPVFVPNSIFSDDKGTYFLLAKEKNEAEIAEKAAKNGCGYIINRGGVAEAWVNGEQVTFPAELTNEMGVTYKFVDYAKYAEICKRVNGYCTASKVEPVILLDIKAGERIQAVVNGVREHDTILEAGMVAVQNMYHGESYSMKVEKLMANYELDYVRENGMQVWKPKFAVQTWTWTSENVFGTLWGGFEFLAKAMINFTDPGDVYGCNYDVFNGNDLANGSHKKLAIFLPVKPLEKVWLTSPEAMSGHVDVLEGVPKSEYVEVPSVYEALGLLN